MSASCKPTTGPYTSSLHTIEALVNTCDEKIRRLEIVVFGALEGAELSDSEMRTLQDFDFISQVLAEIGRISEFLAMHKVDIGTKEFIRLFECVKLQEVSLLLMSGVNHCNGNEVLSFHENDPLSTRDIIFFEE